MIARTNDSILRGWEWHAPAERPSQPRQAAADGCSYLLFGFEALRAGRRELIYARLIGPRTKPFLIDDRPRLCVGVRFAPGFAQALLGVQASAFVDQRPEYDEVESNAESDLDGIREAGTDAERVAAAFALARQRLRSATRVPSSVHAAVARIAAAEGNLRIKSLADGIGITRQHLARQFAVHVGMTVKQFARIKRVEAARARAVAAPKISGRDVNWTTIAHELGYSDQAHLIHDFVALTGSTPGRWRR